MDLRLRIAHLVKVKLGSELTPDSNSIAVFPIPWMLHDYLLLWLESTVIQPP